MNPFEQFQNAGDEVVTLTKKIHEILDSAIDEGYFNREELENVQSQMTDLIRQGVFWLKQENPKRFIYDLKNFLKWLCEFTDTRSQEWGFGEGG